ncbi:MAG: hypothetical protein M5U21_04485 [Fimbriimonadaceae bacterium]|nr:hypothetical protein [Fimbriimonadaceae bacterium]
MGSTLTTYSDSPDCDQRPRILGGGNEHPHSIRRSSEFLVGFLELPQSLLVRAMLGGVAFERLAQRGEVVLQLRIVSGNVLSDALEDRFRGTDVAVAHRWILRRE